MSADEARSASLIRSSLYNSVWRWHFYAGMIVIPFILVLAVTGAAYLFKPQVERWEERAFHGLPVASAVEPHVQVAAALAAFPGTRLSSYRLPDRTGDAAMIHLVTPDGRVACDAFVSPRGEVLGSMLPEARMMAWIKRLHGQLLLGKRGSWLVELVASWAIVLVLSGLYLWWPRRGGLAGVIWPRLLSGKRVFWRDLHAVTGFWISGLVLLLLATGLPWAGLWGGAFKAVRTELGWLKGPQTWTLGGEAPRLENSASHAMHNQAAPMRMVPTPPAVRTSIDDFVVKAKQEQLAFPVIVTPPDPAGTNGIFAWTVRSDAQNRPLQMTITYDAGTGREIAREGFADGHIADRIVGYGIAWHEGQLFGWLNQLIGVLTAIGLIVMAISGFILWRRRKPEHGLGAPPPAKFTERMGIVVAIALVLAAVLPLLAASLVVLWLFERLALPHLPRVAAWLGASRRGAPA
ncbi:PepSY domain-containing protein [Novosphingobium sp. G106]|uniref:PepSY-associated TM helix domain-containing protein n=1 Tax=Novosphingobium sp. G106 TaxID=2849500 RepID=UPI001C2D29C7|nr:PepSY domain-containing protein [Novosphingobium sp. G106]MBV1692028.1 PepSY domain-containing protein [Novosphingobium sp. G106]